MTKGVNAAAAALRQFESQTAGAGKNLDQIGQAGERAGRQVASGAQQATNAVRDLAASGHDVAGSFSTLATGAAVASGALVAGLGLAVKSAADLETAVARVSTIAPDIDTSQVTSELEGMSTRVAQTSTQLAASLNNIFSSIDTNQADALKLTEEFGRGAVAASTDAETFGTAVLGVMNAYGLAATDAGHISDVFFNTIKTGVISGDQLARGLGQVTQQAKLAGVDLNTLGALIAGITREGGDASTNLNNLQNVLNKIATADVQKGFADLGIATKDASGNFRDIVAVLTDLNTKLQTLSAGDRAKVLQDLFPDAQARAGISTLLSQLDTVKSALADNATAAGAANAAYQKMGSTAAAQGQILKNTLVATLTDVGNIALPNLVGLAEKVQGLVAAFGELSPSTQSAIVNGAAVAAGFLLIGSGAIKATATIIQLATAARTAGAALLALTGGGAGLVALLGGVGVALGAADIALRAITNNRTNLKDLTISLIEYGDALKKGRDSANDFFAANKDDANALIAHRGQLEAQLKVLQDINAENAKFSLHALLDLPKQPGRNIDINNILKEIEVLNDLEAAQQHQAAVEADLATRKRQNVAPGFIGPVAPVAGPFLPPGTATDADAAANALNNVNAAAIKGQDALGGMADAASTLLSRFHQTDAQLFAQQLDQTASALQKVQSATAPLATALDQINAKRAAGLPLTAQENSLLSQIPGYLGSATTATAALVEQQAQLAINSINAQGGIAGLAGQAGDASGAISALDGAILALQSHMSALGTENGRLAGEYQALQERIDVLQEKQKEGPGLTAAESAELATLLEAEQKIGQQRADNAAKIRDDILAEQAATQAVQERAAAEAAAAAERAKQPAVTSTREDHTGEVAAPVAPIPVPVVPVGPANATAALAAAMGLPATGAPIVVPVKPEIQGLGGGAANATNAIAQSMGLTGPGTIVTVTADTSAADTALGAIQTALATIQATKTAPEINAVDNASPIAATVTGGIKAIPEIHATEINAVDNASGVIGTIQNEINNLPTSFSITASVDTSGALAAIADLRANMPSSPAEKGPFRTLPDWSSVFSGLRESGDEAVATTETTVQRLADAIGSGMSDAEAEAAKGAAELASSVASAVSAALGALAGLRSFRPPDPRKFAALHDALLPILSAFTADAAGSTEEGRKAASEWADGVGKIIGIVGTGVDALGKLRDFQRPSDQAIAAFRDASQLLVNLMLQIAADTDAGLVAAGAQWADGAGAIFASVGSGVDALTKLRDFRRPADRAATDFRDVSQFVVNLIAQVAADIEDEALPKAKDWAETASAIFSAVGGGVDALAKLHDFERPTDQAVQSFRDVSQYLVNLLAQVAADIEDQALPKARDWAETASALFGALSTGVDALDKLRDFKRPTDQAVESFRDVAQHVVNLFAQVAADIQSEALPGAKDWSEAALAIFGAIGAGIEALGKLNSFARPTDAALESLRDTMARAVALAIEVAATTDAEMVAAAAVYAEAAGKVLALIGSGVQTLGKLGEDEFKPPDRGTLDRIAESSRQAVLAVAAAAAAVDTELVKAAADYSDGAGKAVSLIGAGFAAFSQIAGFVAPSQQQIDQLVAVTVLTVRRIAEAASQMDSEAVKAAGEFGENGGKAIGIVGATLSAFGNMKDFVAPSQEGIDAVLAVTSYAARRLGEIAAGFDPATLKRLGEFGDGVGSGLSAVKAALDIGKSFQDEDRIKPADAIGTALAEFQAGLGPLGELLTLSEQYKREGEQIGTNIAQAYAAIAGSLPGFTPQSQAAASVTVNAGQQVIVHRFEPATIRFEMMSENGAWVVRSMTVDGQSRHALADLMAGELAPIFEAAASAA